MIFIDLNNLEMCITTFFLFLVCHRGVPFLFDPGISNIYVSSRGVQSFPIYLDRYVTGAALYKYPYIYSKTQAGQARRGTKARYAFATKHLTIFLLRIVTTNLCTSSVWLSTPLPSHNIKELSLALFTFPVSFSFCPFLSMLSIRRFRGFLCFLGFRLY